MTSPKLVNLLPKSSKITQKIKKTMTGLLIATLIWLIYVLSGNIGYLPALAAAAFCALFFACFKLKYKSLKAIALILVISAIFILPKSCENYHFKHASDKLWRPFKEEKIGEYVKNGKTVIIDVTANWCLTCKFNHVRVLRSKEVISEIKSENIVAMRADITKHNQRVIDFINKHGRYAIPFNAVFGPCAQDGLLASELLQKEEFLQLINKASCK